MTKYVNITSGVGGGAGVAQRSFAGRLFTTNSLLSTGQVKEFTTLADVGTFFGTTSGEYLRAEFYFGYVSKNITSPQMLSFSMWTNTGAGIETITETLTSSAQTSNNFGSFAFINDLTEAEIIEAATWNNAQNFMFIFCQGTSSALATAYSAALIGFSGTALTLSPISTEHPELCPMILLAATDYSKVNSVINYMFNEFNLTPSVTDTTTSNSYDVLRVNYYGSTQTAGQTISFFQRGLLMGGSTAATDMNTYANEMWLKDDIGSQIMSLLLSVGKVSANAGGRAQLLTTIQAVIQAAVNNGTISIGKTLSTIQQLFITQQTNNPKAYLQVQSIGYWVDAVIESYVTTGGRTEYKAVYTLIYAKDDIIRAVSGTHELI